MFREKWPKGFQMNKKTFVILTLINIVLFIISCVFASLTTAGYLISEIFLVETTFNTKWSSGIKAYYKYKNKLDRYHKICFVLFVAFFALATFFLAYKVFK